MNINNGGSLFNLSASLTLDTGKYEKDIEAAINAADDLADALSDIDDVDISVKADVDGTDDVTGLTEAIDEVDDKDAEIDAEVDGTDSVKDLSGEIEKVGTNSDASGLKVDSLKDKIVMGLAGAATLGAVSGLAKSILGLAGDFSQAGDQVDKESQRLGMSAQAYQEWSYVLSQSGSDITNLGRGMNSLKSAIASPTDAFTDAVNGIGLSVEALAGMSTEDAFKAVISGLQGVGDEAEKNIAAMDIFGSAMGSNLMPLLNTSAEDTQGLVEAAHNLGLIMSDEQVKAAAGYGDALANLQGAVNGLKYDIIEGIVPSLTELYNGLAGVIGFFTGDDDSLTANIERVGTAFVTTIDQINGQQLDAEAIIAAMETLGDPELFTEEDMAQWDAMYSKLKEVCPGVTALFGEQLTATDGATQALRDHITALFDDAKAQAVVDAMSEKQELLTQAYKDQTNALADLRIAEERAKGARTTESRFLNGLTAEQRKRAEDFRNANGVMDWGAWQGFEQSSGLIDSVWLDKDQLDALKESADILAALTDAQKEYDTITADLQDTISYLTEWENALYEISGLDPDDINGYLDGLNANIGKGLTTAVAKAESAASDFKDAMMGLEGEYTISVGEGSVKFNHIPKAKTGLDYVPYDDYLVYLHEGEKVLTKEEANAYRAGAGGGGSADVAALAAAIANRPISFSVGATELAVSMADAGSRANAMRSATISSGYGRGLK